VGEARSWLARGEAAARSRQQTRRAVAGASLAVGFAAAGVAWSRRRFLRAGAAGLAFLGTTGAVGFGTLAESFTPREIEGFAAVSATLDELEGAEGAPT